MGKLSISSFRDDSVSAGGVLFPDWVNSVQEMLPTILAGFVSPPIGSNNIVWKNDRHTSGGFLLLLIRSTVHLETKVAYAVGYWWHCSSCPLLG